jgi:hypothetical protein
MTGFFKLAVQETRPKSLFPRTGQVQSSPGKSGTEKPKTNKQTKPYKTKTKPQVSGSQSETALPSEAALPPGLQEGQWVSSSFQTSPAIVSSPPLPTNGPGMSLELEPIIKIEVTYPFPSVL